MTQRLRGFSPQDAEQYISGLKAILADFEHEDLNFSNHSCVHCRPASGQPDNCLLSCFIGSRGRAGLALPTLPILTTLTTLTSLPTPATTLVP